MSNSTDKIQDGMREAARKMLEEGRVNMVIGYEAEASGKISPAFVRSASEVDRLVWSEACYNNLATYLSRDHVKKFFPVGVVAKGCDMRAINMLLKEHIFERENIVVIGVPCDGLGDPQLSKCASCEVRLPEGVDELVPGEPKPAEGADAFADVDKLDAMTPEERWEHWKGHLERCIRCYACRQVCPMCYCKRCIVEKTEPQWVEFSPHLRGNLSWNVVRAFHLTGRCVGCGECERVCPANIPLGEINGKMAKVVGDTYDYKAGMDAETPSPFTTYDLGVDNDEGIL